MAQIPSSETAAGEEVADDELPARQGVAEEDVYGAALFGPCQGVGEREYREERQRQRREPEELRMEVVGRVAQVGYAESLEHTLRVGLHQLVQLIRAPLDGRERGDHRGAVEPEGDAPDDHTPQLHPDRVRDEREERPPGLAVRLRFSPRSRTTLIAPSPFSRS